MKLSDKGAAFIAREEGFVSHPYKDPVSGNEPISIGCGSTHYENGTKVTMNDDPITIERAIEILRYYVDTKDSPWISKYLPNLIQYEFDSLCSFSYNLGLGNLENSTARKDIQKGSTCETISIDIERWDRACGRVIEGLLERRKREAHLYCTGDYGTLPIIT